MRSILAILLRASNGPRPGPSCILWEESAPSGGYYSPMALKHRSTIGIPTDGFSAIFTGLFWIGVFAAGGYGVFWAIGAIKTRADSEVDRNAPKAMDAHRREMKANNSGSGSRSPAPAFPVTQVRPE